MSKGKFSKNHGQGSLSSCWDRDMEQTGELPEVNPVSPEEESVSDFDLDWLDEIPELRDTDDSSMPEINFENLEDYDWNEIPELSSLELDRPSPAGQNSPLSEDAEIEEAFQQAVARTPVPGSQRKKPGFFSVHRKGLTISGIVAAAVILVSAVLAAVIPMVSDPYDHHILNGVTVAGVNVGGMSRKEAQEAVTQGVESALQSSDMTLVLPEKTMILSHQDLGITLDVPSAVKQAYRYGRTGSTLQKQTDYENSLTGTHAVDLLPFLKLNESYVAGQLKTYTMEFTGVFAPSSYALEGEQPPLGLKEYNENNTCQTLLLNPGSPSTELDPAKVCTEILKAYASLRFSLTITPEQIGQAPEPLDLNKIHGELSVEPVDSVMDKDTFEIISGSYGYSFNLEEAKAQLAQAQYGQTIRIPMEYVAPAVMDDGVLFQDVLSTAETPHGNNANRNTNLRIACETINGTILHPGDEFSFNGTLGERTAEKGYLGAPAYSGTVLVDSRGGGICQVSSTLYYACLLADMEITDRVNHGFLSSYIDPGMDATVSWEKPDFKFRNSSNFPIKLEAETTEDKVIFRILGTDDRDYYVKMEYRDSYIDSETIYEAKSPDSGYSNGDIIQEGWDGHYVTTYRCKYDKQTNVQISRVKEDLSSYPARNTIIASVPEPEPPAPNPGGSGSDTVDPGGDGSDSGGSGEDSSGGGENGSGGTPGGGTSGGGDTNSQPEGSQ